MPEYVLLLSLQVADLAGPRLIFGMWAEAPSVEPGEWGCRIGFVQILQLPGDRQAC